MFGRIGGHDEEWVGRGERKRRKESEMGGRKEE